MKFNNLSDEELVKFLNSQYPYEEILNAMSEAKRRGLKLPEGLDNDALDNDESGTWISGNDFWISGLRFFALLSFVIILAVGILFGINQINNDQTEFGILIFILSFIVAFFSVALIMIFLNLAQDIAILREIRQFEHYKKL